jgi:hypothetical protein
LIGFDRAFRAAFGHGQRLRAAPERGNYVMARENGTSHCNFQRRHEHQGHVQGRRVRALEEVKGARSGQRYTVFSDEELDEIRERLGWLKAAEKSFEFWNDPADAAYAAYDEDELRQRR